MQGICIRTCQFRASARALANAGPLQMPLPMQGLYRCPCQCRASAHTCCLQLCSVPASGSDKQPHSCITVPYCVTDCIVTGVASVIAATCCRKPTKELVDAGLVMLDMQASQVGALFEDVIWSFVQASSGELSESIPSLQDMMLVFGCKPIGRETSACNFI